MTTIVKDASDPAWADFNPKEPHREEWMGEMGKFLDHRPYWPSEGSIAVLYADVYYTEDTIRTIFAHEPKLPTIYGRAHGRGPRESFGIRFDVSEAPEVERIARVVAERRLNRRGGPWRFQFVRLGIAGDYSAKAMLPLQCEENGWVEVGNDATDDFDSLNDFNKWQKRFPDLKGTLPSQS